MLSHFSLSFSSLLLSFSISKHFLTTWFPIHELPAKISLLFDSFNFSIRYTSLLGFHYSSISKESACSAGDPGSNPGSGRSPGGGMATHSSILAWSISWTEEPGGLHTVHGVTESRTRLSD